MDSVVIVDGIPAANKDKLDKLKTVIRKLFKKCDKIVQNEHYPMSEAGETKGYCFLEFPNHTDAVEAVKALHKTKLDKNHILLVRLFSGTYLTHISISSEPRKHLLAITYIFQKDYF